MNPNRRQEKLFIATVRQEALRLGTAIEAPCPYFGECGGCTWQDVPYREQLTGKRRLVEMALAAAGLETIPVGEPLPSPRLYGYRNRMEFSFAARRWLTRAEVASGATFERGFALGMHCPGAFDKVLDLEHCHLQSSAADAVLNVVREFAKSGRLGAWNPRAHVGFWRYVSVRQSVTTGGILVNVTTSVRDAAIMAGLVERLVAAIPGLETVTNGVSDRHADTSEGAAMTVDHGDGFIIESIAGIRFRVFATTFFQPNSRTAATLVDLVAQYADPARSARILDLFCGIGTLSLPAARRGHVVHGLENNPESVREAVANAAENGIEGCTFAGADLRRGLPELPWRPDVVITDPPRSGMAPKLLDDLLALAPEVILSVGCNPWSQAQNLAVLTSGGRYAVERVQPVDQFPQTAQVENVALLRRR